MRIHFIGLAIVFLSACGNVDLDPTRGDGPMGMGSADDPNGAVQWQLDRMKDPATGLIPPGIRKAELAFARSLPKRTEAKSLTWQWRGPRNRGGRTRALAIDRHNPQTLLAGGVTGGMWRSTDDGQTWTHTSDPGTIQSVSCLAQDTRDGHGDTWYYGTGENYGIISGTSFSALMSGNGIYKSTDNGQSWSVLASTVGSDPEVYTRNGSFKQVNSLVIDPNDTINEVVLAAIFNGVVRSTDGGITWNTVLGVDTTNSSTSVYTEVRVTTGGIFYAYVGNGGNAEGLYRSADGINWVDIAPVGFPGNKERMVIGIDPSNEHKVYWFGETPGTGTNDHGIWRYTYLSGDGSGTGGDWENLSANLPNGDCTGYFTFNFGPINTQSSYDMCIAVHPTDSNVVYIGGTNIYRSKTAFTTPDSTKWIGGYKCTPSDPKDYVYDGHHPDQHYMVFSPVDPDRLYSASDGGVSVCADALADSVMWDPLNTGYITSQFYTIHMEEGNATSDLLLGGTQDNGCWLGLTANLNDDWKYVHQDDGAYCAIPEGQNFILTSSQRGRLYKKEIDAAGNIVAYERIDPVLGTNSYNFINQFVLDPADNNKVYWLSASRIWRNYDLAGIPLTNNFYDRLDSNWEQMTTALIPTSQRITTLDISLAQRSLFYGTINSHLYRLDDIDSATPVKTEITSSLWPSNAYVSCIAPNDLDGDEWLMTFSNYGVVSIWHTTDGGTTWASVSGNLEENINGSGSGPAVFWASIYPTFGGASDQYFVGTSTGLYSTDLLDGDNTIWQQEGPSTIGNVPINMIALRNSDGTIAVATHGHGVFSSLLPAAPIGVEENTAISNVAIWPVPANDHINLKADFRGVGQLQLHLHDMHGRTVLKRDLGSLSGNVDTRIPLPQGLANGNYVLALWSGNKKKFTRTIQIQHVQ